METTNFAAGLGSFREMTEMSGEMGLKADASLKN